MGGGEQRGAGTSLWRYITDPNNEAGQLFQVVSTSREHVSRTQGG